MYIFILWFLLSSFFISSPNLSGRTLDVYYTSTHGLKCAACGSLKYRTQKWRKNSPSGHYRTTLSGYIFAIKACIDNQKKLVKQQYLSHMYIQYGERLPTSGWHRFVSLGHPSKFHWLSRLGSVTARYSISGRQPNFAVLNRGRHLYSAGRPSRWPHSSLCIFLYRYCCKVNFRSSNGYRLERSWENTVIFCSLPQLLILKRVNIAH